MDICQVELELQLKYTRKNISAAVYNGTINLIYECIMFGKVWLKI